MPVLLVVALYAKNKVLFGHFAASTWTGMSLGHLTIDPLPRVEAERLVAAGTLSPASRVPAFSRARVYQGAYFEPPPATRVRALYWEEKTTGAPNYNHAAYIRISEDLLRDALWVLRHRPRVYLASVREAWSIYFRGPGGAALPGRGEHRRHPAGQRPLRRRLLPAPRRSRRRDERSPARYWALIVGLPLVFVVGLVAALGRGPGARLDPDSALLAAFLCFTIAYVAVLGNSLELGENNRFRFETDPLSVCLLGLALQFASVPCAAAVRPDASG